MRSRRERTTEVPKLNGVGFLSSVSDGFFIDQAGFCHVRRSMLERERWVLGG